MLLSLISHSFRNLTTKSLSNLYSVIRRQHSLTANTIYIHTHLIYINVKYFGSETIIYIM